MERKSFLKTGTGFEAVYIFINPTMAKPKSAPAKYDDKSAGQPELLPVFNAIKKLISGYVKGDYTLKADKPGQYELYYDKEVDLGGKRYPELGFAGLLIQKGYVGFYFFPVYVNDELKKDLDPELLKMLKGKTCFHIKKEDPELLKQIKHALDTGYNYYKSRGWD